MRKFKEKFLAEIIERGRGGAVACYECRNREQAEWISGKIAQVGGLEATVLSMPERVYLVKVRNTQCAPTYTHFEKFY